MRAVAAWRLGEGGFSGVGGLGRLARARGDVGRGGSRYLSIGDDATGDELAMARRDAWHRVSWRESGRGWRPGFAAEERPWRGAGLGATRS